MISEAGKKWAWVVGLFCVVFALTAGTYWEVLTDPAQVLAFNDGNIECMLSPAYQFPGALWRVWDNQFFFGMGGKQYPLTITGIGESIGPVFWRSWGPAVVLGLCALAFYWMLRQYKLVRPVAALTAAFLAGTGACHNFAVAGLAVRPIAMACAALALGFIEQGRRQNRWLPYILAGGCLGFGVSEVPDVGLFYALATAIVFWWTHLFLKCEIGNLKEGNRKTISAVIGLFGKFALYVGCSVLLAWQTIGVMFAVNIQGVTQGGAESPESRYAWATQWSIPPAEMWNAVSGSYFGRSMRSEEFPYWGRLGRDANWEATHQGFRNFTLTGWHLGVVPCALLLALLVHLLVRKVPPRDGDEREQTGKKKRALTTEDTEVNKSNSKRSISCDPWIAEAPFPSRSCMWMALCLCVLAMLLMWGRYFPLYHAFWSLPYFGTFRNPEKWNGVLTLFTGLGVGLVLEMVARSLSRHSTARSGKIVIIESLFYAATGLALLAVLVGVGTLTGREGFVAARLSEGYGTQAEIMWDNAVMASFMVFLLAGVFAGGMWWLRHGLALGKEYSPALVFLGIAVLILGNTFFDNRHYIVGHHYRSFLQDNPLTLFLDAQRTEGRIKLMPPGHPLLNNLRLTLLQLKGYDLFEPVSVSRMPADYAAFFQALEKQPIRLWEMGALRYCLTLPGAVGELNRLDGNRGRFVERLALGLAEVEGNYMPVSAPNEQQAMLRLVEFMGALPKYRFAGRVMALAEGDEGDRVALARIGANDFQPDKETLIHAKLNTRESSANGIGKIVVRKEVPTEVVLEVDAMAPTWLVRSAKFDADWKVTRDNRPTELVRADFLFQAVYVPAGRSVLEFQYRPSLRATWFALTGRIGLILIFLFRMVWLACSKNSRQASGLPLAHG